MLLTCRNIEQELATTLPSSQFLASNIKKGKNKNRTVCISKL